MSHGSARLSVDGGRLIDQRHQAGWRQAPNVDRMGVSRKCVKAWIDRYAAEGDSGLVTRSSRPHSMPTKISDEVEQKFPRSPCPTSRRARRARPPSRGAGPDCDTDPAPPPGPVPARATQ